MFIIRNAFQTPAGLPGVRHRTLAGSEQGLKHLSIWRQEIASGHGTPAHRHDCEEVVVVEAGQGELHAAGQAMPFGPDTTLIIPPNVVHRILNTGHETLHLTAALSVSPVQVFLPTGEPLSLPWKS
jgi:mannose-6-phosphate isomerase-like protein (cupin superfamily)